MEYGLAFTIGFLVFTQAPCQSANDGGYFCKVLISVFLVAKFMQLGGKKIKKKKKKA
jgi:hypothetical protein